MVQVPQVGQNLTKEKYKRKAEQDWGGPGNSKTGPVGWEGEGPDRRGPQGNKVRKSAMLAGGGVWSASGLSKYSNQHAEKGTGDGPGTGEVCPHRLSLEMGRVFDKRRRAPQGDKVGQVLRNQKNPSPWPCLLKGRPGTRCCH